MYLWQLDLALEYMVIEMSQDVLLDKLDLQLVVYTNTHMCY